jgi:hypothetical protein
MNWKGLDMSTTATMLSRMAEAGVPLKEARWYHTVGRPRQFKGPGDPQRMIRILKTVNAFFLAKRQVH